MNDRALETARDEYMAQVRAAESLISVRMWASDSFSKGWQAALSRLAASWDEGWEAANRWNHPETEADYYLDGGANPYRKQARENVRPEEGQ